MKRTEIEHKAHLLLKRYKVLAPPVPVEEIAAGEGIQLVRQRFEGPQSGFALHDGDMRIIGVNTLTSRRRQRFTVGHEIGHLVLHAEQKLIVDQQVQVFKRDELSSTATNQQEIEANAYAAALLMPGELVHTQVAEIMRSEQTRDSLISELARVFDVSAEAMGFRLVNLGILVP